MEDYLTQNYFWVFSHYNDVRVMWYDVIFILWCMLLCTHACTRT